MPKSIAKVLTRAAVERFRYKPDGSRIQRLWDASVPGLGVEVFASGRKSWIYRYRIAGQQRFLTLGAIAELSLDDARDAAIKARGEVRVGDDPKALRNAPDGALTVRALWEQYQSTPHFQTRSQDHRDAMTSTLRAHVLPRWGHLPLTAIKRWQIRQAVDELIADGREGAARALLTRIRLVMNYAIEYELLEASPADHIKPRFTTTGRRDAWLKTDDELRAAWWIDAPIQVRLLVRWVLLTGCRRDEARLTTRDQISDAWRVEATKTGNPLVLPMMPAMAEIVTESKAAFGATDWLFPSTTTNFREIPRGTINWQIRWATKGAWSLHVLRHTVESHLRELGIAEEARDAVLNHVRKGSGARYGHGDQLDTKRAALSAWHHKLQDIV